MMVVCTGSEGNGARVDSIGGVQNFDLRIFVSVYCSSILMLVYCKQYQVDKKRRASTEIYFVFVFDCAPILQTFIYPAVHVG